MEDSGMSSFWGPVTSTTELCEENYAHSSYIAEFYNTISNIPCILFALIGLTNALRQRLQQSDETPMVWEMLLYLYVLYSPDWHYRSTMPTFLFLYGAAFAVAHSLVRFGIGFKIHYVGLCLLCIPRMYKYYIQTKDASAKRLAKLYVATIFLGTICWLFDRMFCKKLSHWYINPQGHAWWHVLMGFNSYFANAFLMFCRAQQLGWEPQVVHLFGVFPYVKIHKPKKQE
ncbi:alkaline ceramidase-like isoform X2 [Musa acuminata AAA Group]|uniref:alkaline ceramidase-like isoform X2 n=1 Tax=Musa acuminata AAA Group TaxID=214697 RepID=UPI0031D00840